MGYFSKPLIAVLMIAFSPTNVSAQDIYAKCVSAVEADNLEDIKKYAETIIRLRNLSREKIERGLRCINYNGGSYSYDFDAGKFVDEEFVRKREADAEKNE